jgi:hypothetical protein
MMRRALAPVWLGCLSLLLLTQAALADSGGNTANDGAHGLNPTALVGVAVLLMIAKLGVSSSSESNSQPYSAN